MTTREQFVKHLRDGLNHLHDPDRLRKSPLIALFRVDTPLALQRILSEGIESLEPEADEPSGSRAWQIYEPLFYRYVQRLRQREVADQMGFCARHVRRKQRAALETLADRLWKEFDLEVKSGEDADAAEGPTVSEELAWLKNLAPESPTDLNRVLPAVLDLARPLAAQHQARLDIAVADDLVNLVMHPVALRQTLLNLLTVAIPRSPGGRVRISARPLRWEVEIQVRCMKSTSRARPVSDDDTTSLEMARRLADMSGGKLICSKDKGAFGATLTLPALERLPVLVIDDNADTLQLLRRYAAGTRYRLVGVRDPERALSLADQLSPQIIVLDVMMPHVDGWEILGRLRQHPLSAHIPVVVCTIMAQETLALSLGASGFVHKPVTRQAFLEALDRQVALMASGSR